MTSEGEMLPLRGVRVLDLGQYISGPCTTVLLAEMGADVIKVEPPGHGDPFRRWETGRLAATFVAFNRGKRSIVLDLKSEEDKEKFLTLVETVDVVVENFRPGVMSRLGLDYDRMRKRNSGLVHCSITGFGSSGPYADLPAYDGVALGYSGLAGLLMESDDPRMRGPAMADAITGHSAAFSILAALLERHRNNQSGKHLEISMLGALAHFLHSSVAKKVVEGVEEGPYSRSHLSQTYAFVAKGGEALIIHLSSPAKFWEGLCAAVGRPNLLEDPRFADRQSRCDNYETLQAELKPIFATRGRDEWLDILQEHEVPCAPVNRIGEVLDDEQMQHLGIIDVLDESELGPMPRIRPPIHVDGEPLPPVPRAPFLGEHTESVLQEAAELARIGG